MRAHVLLFTDLMWYLFAHCSLQPSMSPWSSEDTAQTSSPSSVDTVRLEWPHCGYTMIRQWRVAMPLALPSLVQCTLFKLYQSTPHVQLILEWTVYMRWMDTSFVMKIWATSSRAMLFISPTFLRSISLETHLQYVYIYWICLD